MTTIMTVAWAVVQILLPIIINGGAPPAIGDAVQEPPPPVNSIPTYPGDIEQAITDAVGIGKATPNAWGHGEGWTEYVIVGYVSLTWTLDVTVCRNINCDTVTITIS